MRFWITLLFLVASLSAQSSGTQDIANLREDVRLLSQRVGELSLKVEQLERENSQLQRKAESGNVSYVTLQQLNDAIAELNRNLKTAIANSRADTLQIVAGQLEKLGNQTNAALESVARGSGARVATPSAAPASTPSSAPSAPSAFSDSYPKEGISYTVVRGDNLAKIAQKTGARSADIINANKISDPSKIQAGQVLFIPGGK